MARAQALVPDPGQVRRGVAATRGRRFGSLHLWGRGTAWAGVALATLLICVMSFELGRLGTRNLVAMEVMLTEELSLGLGGTVEELL